MSEHAPRFAEPSEPALSRCDRCGHPWPFERMHPVWRRGADAIGVCDACAWLLAEPVKDDE